MPMKATEQDRMESFEYLLVMICKLVRTLERRDGSDTLKREVGTIYNKINKLIKK